MRRWWTDATAAARLVAERPPFWLPGALVWLVTVGWIPMLVAVARAPTVADLTFFGAAIYTSGAWPLNAVVFGVAAFAVICVGFALAAVGEGALIALSRRRRLSAAYALRVLGITVVTAAPTLFAALLLVIALAFIAPTEFTAPDAGAGPVIRTLSRAAPFLGLIAVTMAIGSAFHAAATRAVIGSGNGLVTALVSSPRRLARAGTSGVAQAASVLAARFVYLALSVVIMAMLWTPIGARLTKDGFDPATSLLLVGFVAIWLCLVLAGGALHAWGSVTWTSVLDRGVRWHGPDFVQVEASADR